MTQPLPLTDVCVIEIGHSIAAPYAGQIFSQLGARVIKIESSTVSCHEQRQAKYPCRLQ